MNLMLCSPIWCPIVFIWRDTNSQSLFMTLWIFSLSPFGCLFSSQKRASPVCSSLDKTHLTYASFYPCVFLQTSSNRAAAFLELQGTELHKGFNIWMYLRFPQELREILWLILSFSLLMLPLSSWQPPHTKLTFAWTSLPKSQDIAVAMGRSEPTTWMWRNDWFSTFSWSIWSHKVVQWFTDEPCLHYS